MNGTSSGSSAHEQVRLALQQERLDRGEVLERVLLVGGEADLALGERPHVDEHLQSRAVEVGSGDRDRRRSERGPRFLGRHLEGLHQVIGRSDGAGKRRQGRPGP